MGRSLRRIFWHSRFVAKKPYNSKSSLREAHQNPGLSNMMGESWWSPIHSSKACYMHLQQLQKLLWLWQLQSTRKIPRRRYLCKVRTVTKNQNLQLLGTCWHYEPLQTASNCEKNPPLQAAKKKLGTSDICRIMTQVGDHRHQQLHGSRWSWSRDPVAEKKTANDLWTQMKSESDWCKLTREPTWT